MTVQVVEQVLCSTDCLLDLDRKSWILGVGMMCWKRSVGWGFVNKYCKCSLASVRRLVSCLSWSSRRLASSAHCRLLRCSTPAQQKR